MAHRVRYSPYPPKEMDPFFQYLIFFGIVVAILYVLFFKRSARVKNKLYWQDEVEVKDIMEGKLIKISGKVAIFGEHLSAPISGLKCYYYHLIITENPEDSKHSETLVDEERMRPYIVFKKEDLYIIAELKSALSYVIRDNEFRSGTGRDPNYKMKRVLRKHAIREHLGYDITRELYYTEALIEEDERVQVYGKAQWKDPKELGFDIPAEKVLFIQTDAKNRAYVTDDKSTV